MSNLPDVYIFGAGDIGLQHAAAFKQCGAEITIISQNGGVRHSPVGIEYETCAVSEFDFGSVRRQGVVIALPIKEQIDLLENIASKNPGFVLVEKPGSFELERLETLNRESDFPIYVAYNRRFLESVLELKNQLNGAEVFMIKCDASENIPRLQSVVSDEFLLNNWHFANSCHVLDLVRFLAGERDLVVNSKSSSGRSRFSELHGAVCCDFNIRNCKVLYTADFRVSGSWVIEVVSSVGRFRLSPIEQLTVFDETRFSFRTVELDSFESEIKPGFVKQAMTVLNHGDSAEKAYLCKLGSALENLRLMADIYSLD